ncbi:MAG: alpha/beta hydrolase [Lachnospiraceae bacterium]|nr:alpha/beta hydrolase [Lachnospiraceae bacterium]
MRQIIKTERKQEVLSLVTGLGYSTVPVWYNGTFTDLKMDLIVPKHREDHAACPAVVWLCGGAYRVVNHSIWMPEFVRLARAGFVVASVEYRTSSEARFPAPLIDVKAAIRYLKAHAKDFCIDPEKIFIMGESAGGSLASLAGVTGGIEEFEQGEYLEQDSRVAGIVDFYGVVEMTKRGDDSSKSLPANDDVPYFTTEEYLGVGYSDETAEKASAISYVSKNTPPTMILHGGADVVVPIIQSELFYKKLTECGVYTEFYVIEGALHGDDLFYQDEVMDKVLAFLKKHC